MTEREKEYVCDKLCRYPYLLDNEDHLFHICEICLLNKSRTELRKEYMKQYYKTKIKPDRMKKKLNREYGILDKAIDGPGIDGNVKEGEAE